MATRIVEASGDEVLHAESAHVAERHWRAGRLTLLRHWRGAVAKINAMALRRIWALRQYR
jgi:hypothetical protein